MIRKKKIGTGKLNKVVTSLVNRQIVILQYAAGTRFKVKYASMLKSSPPTFLLFANKSKKDCLFSKYVIISFSLSDILLIIVALLLY